MIIVQIIGGLGNQMFQYALGRHLAKLNNTELKLDITTFEAYKLHNYALSNLAIQANLASALEINRLKTNRLLRKLNLAKPSHIIEADQTFNESVLQLRGDFYLEGYWQTEKYFKDIAEIIKHDFRVKAELSGRNREVAEQIATVNAVSVHVRRGDYAANQETLKIHGLCGPEYYNQAVSQMAEKVSQPNFFVFSDDPAWAKDNLIFAYPTFYLGHNQADKNYEDLRLMNLCRHNIIANSSFSWWGAWLNNHPQKIVVAPQKWYNDSSKNIQDIIPDNWIKI